MQPDEARELARTRDAMLRVIEEARKCVDAAAEDGVVDLRDLEKSLLELSRRETRTLGDGIRLSYRGRDDWRSDMLYPGPFVAERGGREIYELKGGNGHVEGPRIIDGRLESGIWRVRAGDGVRVWVGTDSKMAEFVAEALTSEACSRAHSLKEAGEVNYDEIIEDE